MAGRSWARVWGVALTGILTGISSAQIESVNGENCSYRADPGEYLSRQFRARRDIYENAGKFHGNRRSGGKLSVPASEIPRRNLIDHEIFGRLESEGIASARLSSDAEFVRRIYLDLNGRLPSPDEVREFLEDTSPTKRAALIDRLLVTPEFVYKWSIWMGELVQNAQALPNVNRQMVARNTYFDWIKYSIADQKPLNQMAWEALTASGNTYYVENGAANFTLNGRAVMGPAQDTYDWMLYNATSKFLGVGHYDCLLCHDGRRHLDDLSVWGKSSTRLDAQRMAAFFSRTRLTQNNVRDDPAYLSFTVSDVTTGNYGLNTNFGNRPNRAAVGSLTSLTPEYGDGWKPSGAAWRREFADKLVNDPLFSLNFANRLWKEIFNYGLVEPVDSLDPARLDPDNPPPAPWSLQASHPALLRALAAELRSRNYSLREFVRLLVESSAYQLSSRYDGEWNLSMAPLFARHYPRRLLGEEIADAIVKATGMVQEYTVAGFNAPLRWAIELPEPGEPRGGPAGFLNVFQRGNRATQFRSQAGSIVQQLYLMNDAFVLNRVRVTAAPNLQAISRIPSNEDVVTEMFLLFLSRYPTEIEKGYAMGHLARSATTAARNTAIEDLAWALINKAEFIFSY